MMFDPRIAPNSAPMKNEGSRSRLINLYIKIARPTLVPSSTAPCRGIRIDGGNIVVIKANNITPPPRPAPTPIAPDRQLRNDKRANTAPVIPGIEVKISNTIFNYFGFLGWSLMSVR